MRNCEKCLENSWEFKTIRDVNEEKQTYIKYCEATCNLCGHQVEFGHKELSLNKPYGGRRFNNKLIQ